MSHNGDGPRTDYLSDHTVLQADHEAAPDQLLTAEQVGERWQVPKAHVYRLARGGKLPAVELGKYKRFSLSVLLAFEAKGGTPPR